MIFESASVWVGLGLDTDRRTFLASVQVSFFNFLCFLWSAEIVQRHKQQLGLLIIQLERADVIYALVSHHAWSDLTPK